MGDDIAAIGASADLGVSALLGSGQHDPAVEGAARRGDYRIIYITEKKLFAKTTLHN